MMNNKKVVKIIALVLAGLMAVSVLTVLINIFI